TGHRLGRDSWQPGDGFKILLQVVEHLERALGVGQRRIGVQLGETGQSGRDLVNIRIVLHGTGAERVAGAIGADILFRQGGKERPQLLAIPAWQTDWLTAQVRRWHLWQGDRRGRSRRAKRLDEYLRQPLKMRRLLQVREGQEEMVPR